MLRQPQGSLTINHFDDKDSRASVRPTSKESALSERCAFRSCLRCCPVPKRFVLFLSQTTSVNVTLMIFELRLRVASRHRLPPHPRDFTGGSRGYRGRASQSKMENPAMRKWRSSALRPPWEDHDARHKQGQTAERSSNVVSVRPCCKDFSQTGTISNR